MYADRPPLVDDDGAPLLLLGSAPLRGGEASVYQAEDAAGRRVAVKVAHLPGAEWLSEERALLGALGEDPATAGLVARVRGGGVWGERPFLVLDWYPCTLDSWLAGEPPWDRRIAMAARLAEAVAALHGARPTLVHRDLKPTNVLLDAEERVLLADFGASRVAAPGETMTLRALHTPGYGPPEAVLPGPQRPAQDADVYALAATIFHVLVGRPPAAPRSNAERLTPDGERLLLGILDRTDADTERWLDFARMSALDARDRRDLAATIGRGRAYAALLAALEPHPSRRRGGAAEIAAALADRTVIERARHSERGARVAGVLGGTTVAVAAAVAVGVSVGPPPMPPAPMVDFAPGRYEDPVTRAISHMDHAFRLAVHEVTQAEWRAVTGQDPASFRENIGARAGYYCTQDYRGISTVQDDFPVACVSWFDAVRFANERSEREGLDPAYRIALPDGTHPPVVAPISGADGYRLPTRDEWIYAAVLGSSAPLPPYAQLGPCRVGNLADGTSGVLGTPHCDDGFEVFAPIGSFLANPAGLHDVYGNVSEWLWDEGGDGERLVTGVNFGSTIGEPPAGFAAGPAPAAARSLGIGLRLARSSP